MDTNTIKNQESCIINEGTTTKYFKLEKGTSQGDPISAYLFILVLEIVFLYLKENKNIKGINIFCNIFLYSFLYSYILIFLYFFIFLSLKPNMAKCEIAGIGVLKGVSLALHGMDCINLTKKTITILGIHFSYNKKLATEDNFVRHVWKIEKVLKVMENAKSDCGRKNYYF